MDTHGFAPQSVLEGWDAEGGLMTLDELEEQYWKWLWSAMQYYPCRHSFALEEASFYGDRIMEICPNYFNLPVGIKGTLDGDK